MIGTWNRYPINKTKKTLYFYESRRQITVSAKAATDTYVTQEMLNTFHGIISHVYIVFYIN